MFGVFFLSNEAHFCHEVEELKEKGEQQALGKN